MAQVQLWSPSERRVGFAPGSGRAAQAIDGLATLRLPWQLAA